MVHGQSDLENPRMLTPSTYKNYRVIIMLTFLVEGYDNRPKLENLTLICESLCHMISEIHFEPERCKQELKLFKIIAICYLLISTKKLVGSYCRHSIIYKKGDQSSL